MESMAANLPDDSTDYYLDKLYVTTFFKNYLEKLS